jgi:pteridine reductase
MKSRSSRPAVLITGGAKRLGHAMALHLADQGYDIALHYHRSKAEAMHTAKTIDQKGVRCELFACDLADEKAVLALLPTVYKAFQGLRVLINSASIFIPNEFGDQDLNLFKAHWDINFKAPYILSCAFHRLAKKGQIINLIDTNTAKYTSRYADYLLTKKALGEFTKMAAAQWGPAIRVNGISPGMVLPPINHPDDHPVRAAKIPLRQVGHPKYIVQALQFLIANDYITGQIIAVDGGENLI